MNTFFALVVLGVVAMAAGHHEEGHVGTQPVAHPDTHPVEHTHETHEVAKPTKDLKGSEAVYIAAPYRAYPYAYNAYPYAYGAYPAYPAYPYYG